ARAGGPISGRGQRLAGGRHRVGTRSRGRGGLSSHRIEDHADSQQRKREGEFTHRGGPPEKRGGGRPSQGRGPSPRAIRRPRSDRPAEERMSGSSGFSDEPV